MSAPSISGLGLPFLLHKIEQMSFTRSQSVQRIVENPLTSTKILDLLNRIYLLAIFVCATYTDKPLVIRAFFYLGRSVFSYSGPQEVGE